MTGLTSNPTIFDQAIKSADVYDEAIRKKVVEGKSGEVLFFELALEDLTQAADLFRPIHDATGGVDGWVLLEVRTTPPAPSRRRRNCMRARNAPIFSSRSRVPAQAFRRSRRRSSRGVPVNVTQVSACLPIFKEIR